ncbi:MAG TPA: NAD(P)H-dependent oxidoreductase [Pseudolysinimonas sp.]|nr:NAD(P)H-dependent oxidoreductase [Pseudolysinimonas sp.]
MERTPVLAICGSLRSDSLHRGVLRAIEGRAPGLQLLGGELIPELPLLNPDLDTPDRMPTAVREFRLLAEACQGAIIASPEYVNAPSGVTKNALDWLVGSTGLYAKPVLLVSASPGQTGGIRGLAALVPTLLAMDATLVDPVSISHAAGRILPDGTVRDAGLDLRLDIALEQLTDAMALNPSRAAL